MDNLFPPREPSDLRLRAVSMATLADIYATQARCRLNTADEIAAYATCARRLRENTETLVAAARRTEGDVLVKSVPAIPGSAR